MVHSMTSCYELWSKSIINPITTKGDLSELQNYRGIELVPTAVKVYNKMLLNRIRPQLDSPLCTNSKWFPIRQVNSFPNTYS